MIEEKMLLKLVPDLYDYETVLYIGASVNRHQLVSELHARDYMIDLLEAWELNVERLKRFKFHLFKEIIWGDVREVDTIIFKTYDIVVWLQGPEHINRSALKDTLDKLCKMATYFVVVTFPWGKRPQGSAGGNPHERHRTYLYPKDLEELDWEGCAVGQCDERNSYVIAWKRRKLLKE